MTWTYSGDPGKSAKDLVRFLIQDTDAKDQQLQDGEITYILSVYNNKPANAAIRLCEVLIAKYTRMADEGVGQVRIQFSQKSKAYRTLLTDLKIRLATESMQPYAGGVSQSDVDTVNSNMDRVKPDFSKHMMENELIAPWLTETQIGFLQEGD